ncbi:MAG: A24 family peptidase [Proteobacteria bacterium]|nr:A24 family peptidase [Pseudomonadota bacterium]
MLLALESSPPAWIAVFTILGLLVGSFLNVVIYRTPVILERDWKHQAREILGIETDDVQVDVFNLVVPRSRCQQCNALIRAWQNIPVLSYILLRGRCAKCAAPISLRYPLIELLTGVLTGFLAWKFGASWELAGAIIFTWALLALTFIDFDHQLLPDDITLGLLWLGLAFSLGNVFVSPRDAIIGAISGYLSLWLIFHAFRLLTGKEGMGYGDFKLFAALGAWLGWQMLPLVILFSSATGAILGGALIALHGRDRAQPIPFGPFLAIAGLIAFLWGDAILGWYLDLYRP